MNFFKSPVTVGADLNCKSVPTGALASASKETLKFQSGKLEENRKQSVRTALERAPWNREVQNRDTHCNSITSNTDPETTELFWGMAMKRGTLSMAPAIPTSYSNNWGLGSAVFWGGTAVIWHYNIQAQFTVQAGSFYQLLLPFTAIQEMVRSLPSSFRHLIHEYNPLILPKDTLSGQAADKEMPRDKHSGGRTSNSRCGKGMQHSPFIPNNHDLQLPYSPWMFFSSCNSLSSM